MDIAKSFFKRYGSGLSVDDKIYICYQLIWSSAKIVSPILSLLINCVTWGNESMLVLFSVTG